MSQIKWTKQDVINKFQEAALQSIGPAPAGPAEPGANPLAALKAVMQASGQIKPKTIPPDRRAALQRLFTTLKAGPASVPAQNQKGTPNV